MSESYKLLGELESLIHDLIEKQESLERENSKLKDEIALISESLNNSKVREKELENINKRLKIMSGLYGSKENRQFMKIKINQLIKEVDFCITELKNTSI